MTRTVARVGFLLLLSLHLIGPPESPAPGLWFGWMPDELAFRLAWMAAAWLYLLWFCAVVWRDDEAAGPDDGGDGAPKPGEGAPEPGEGVP